MIDIVDLFNACLYIQDHLEADLSLMFLAQTVGLSRFRFHRVFKAWRGETLHDFVTRMRMERAAFELAYPIPRSTRRSIKSIAEASGYKSLSSFSHAFSSYSQLSPREFRHRALHQRPRRAPATPSGAAFEPFSISVAYQPLRELAVLDRPVGSAPSRKRRARAPDRASELNGGRFWVELLPNLMARANADGPGQRVERLGCVGVPLEQWQAAQASQSDAHPRSTIRLEAGRYAVIEGVGSPKALYRVWRRSFDEWLARTGECPKAGRLYVRLATPEDGTGTVALHVPLEAPERLRRLPES